MFSFLFTALFLGAIFWGAKTLMNDGKPRPAVTSNQLAFKSFMEEEKHRRSKQSLQAKRREGSPRFHRAAVKNFLPYGLICLAPVVLTLVLLPDPIAVGLMVAGCSALGLIVFSLFNRQEHIAYNETLDQNGYVNDSLAQLDAFVIPEDWTRKYK